jgi:4-amino-4-deoxy-L-arabinose transferase-like glycosyltransferase
VIAALVFRLAAARTAPSLDNDQIRYLVVSHHISSGVGYFNWNGPETHVHPLHPWLTSLLPGGQASLERRGRLVTLIASLLLLVPVGLLAKRLGGLRAAKVALLLVSVHPWLVRASPTVEPEGLYALCCATALCFLVPPLDRGVSLAGWAGAGLFFGLAYLARPEGLIVGIVAGVIACLHGSSASRSRFLGPAAFLFVMLAAASPFLFLLHRATGRWTLTGKVDHVFMVGQINETQDPGAAMNQFRSIKENWRGIPNYVKTHPAQVLAGSLRSAAAIGFSILPRALGPLGIIGCLACAFLWFSTPQLRSRILMILSPLVALLLMLVVPRSERVLGSLVPFFMVTASLGLSRLAGRRFLRTRRLRWGAMIALIAGALVGWGPAAGRWWIHPRATGPRFDTEVVITAGSLAGPSHPFVTDNPVLSFYARDPLLFGPPGRYVGIEAGWTCQRVMSLMRDRATRVAVLDLQWLPLDLPAGAADCPLRLERTLRDPREGRTVSIYRLEDQS